MRAVLFSGTYVFFLELLIQKLKEETENLKMLRGYFPNHPLHHML